MLSRVQALRVGTPAMAELEFPGPLQCLFTPKRYKVLWGGRGAGRSWGCARALLVLARQKPIRVLCAREFQNSIDESVHKVIADQIQRLGWDEFFDIQKTKITSSNGSSFVFEGVKNNTTRVKSYEGIDYCWIEEGAKISKASFEVIEPTIRKDGSEIWISLNPELAEDYVYKTIIGDRALKTVRGDRFGASFDAQRIWESNPGPPTGYAGSLPDEYFGTISCRMTYADNPWFPIALASSMQKMKETDYDAYMNVWEGFPRQELEGAVYAKELRKAQEQNRICSVPIESSVPVDTYWDLGKADATAIWFIQHVAMQIRLVDYLELTGADVEDIVQELQKRSYNYGIHVLPFDAEHKILGMRKTIKEQVQAFYPGRVRIARKIAIVDGQNMVRMLFNKFWFDEDNCEDGLHALRHFRYEVKDGRLSDNPKHDWASHAASALRYFAVSFQDPDLDWGASRETKVAETLLKGFKSPFLDKIAGGLAWMGN